MQIRIARGLFALIVAASAVFPQQPEVDATKLKELRRASLMAKVSADLEQLKLPENRAILSAKLGAVAWRTDRDDGKKLL